MFEVATWVAATEVATWKKKMESRRSRNGAELIGCRDIILRSRHE